jgi:hypothetical protein
MIILLVLLLVLLFFGLGFTAHLLWVVAAIVLFAWIIGLALASLFHAGSGHVRSGVPSVTRASGGRVVRAHLAAGAREVRDLSVAA